MPSIPSARIVLGSVVVFMLACANEVYRDPNQTRDNLVGDTGGGQAGNDGSGGSQPVGPCGGPVPAAPWAVGTAVASSGAGGGSAYFCSSMIEDANGHMWTATCDGTGSCHCLVDDVELCGCQVEPPETLCDFGAVPHCCPDGWPVP